MDLESLNWSIVELLALLAGWLSSMSRQTASVVTRSANTPDSSLADDTLAPLQRQDIMVLSEAVEYCIRTKMFYVCTIISLSSDICQAKYHVCQTIMRYGLTNCQIKEQGGTELYTFG